MAKGGVAVVAAEREAATTDENEVAEQEAAVYEGDESFRTLATAESDPNQDDSAVMTGSILAAIGTTGDEYCDKLLERLNPEGKPGEIEDYYDLAEKLGEGAFASVYRGISKETGAEVAIKIVDLIEKEEITGPGEPARPTLIGSSEALAKRREMERTKKLRRKVRILENEITIMRRIARMPPKRRKALVKITDTLANSRRICFTMELLTGGELFDRVLMKQNYTERDAAHLLRRMMKGVRSLHKAGIIHRDLKPENLVFETQYDDSRVKITDFGLATVVGHPDIFRKIVVGSPGYIAPEIINDKIYTTACDIWSMGCILFILLVGGPPFGGANNQELFDNIKSGQYRYPGDCAVSDDAKDLISKMLCLNHDERITAQGVLQHPWLVKKAQYADLHNAVQKLRAFNTRRKLKAVAAAMVWGGKSMYAERLRQLLLGTNKEEGFSGDELEKLRERLFEKCGEGKSVDQATFIQIYESMGWNDLPLIDMFAVFKEEKGDCADVSEICIGMSTTGKDWNGNAALRYCFETFDRDGTGSINKEDVMKILKAVMGEERFMKIAPGFKRMFEGYFFKSKKVSYNDFVAKFIKYGDFNWRENIARPVQQLIKRATMIGRNRLSSALTLASVKSITSRLSHDDDMALMSAAAAAVAQEEEEDVDDDDDSDDDSDDEHDNKGKKWRPGKGTGFFAKTLTIGRRRNRKQSASSKPGGYSRKSSKQRSSSAAIASVRKTSQASTSATEGMSQAQAKEAMRTFTRKQPVPPKGPKPKRKSNGSGFTLNNFDLDEEM